MIRIVSEFTPDNKKFLLVLCDHQNCGNYSSHEIDQSKPIDESVAASIVVITQMYGYSIGLLGQICPQHLEKVRQQQRLVQPVNSFNGKDLSSLIKH